MQMNSEKPIQPQEPSWLAGLKENTLTLEEAFQRLEEVAQSLEDPQAGLEASFSLYRQGVDLLRYCQEKLDTVEKKMLQLEEDGSLHEFSR